MELRTILGEAHQAAKGLLGWKLVRQLPDGTELRGRIVETEAYHQHDPAAHSFRGQTKRTAPMFGPSGHAYVYFIYGNHWCMNVVAGPVGRGEAVLIRALEPLGGTERMITNRGGIRGVGVTNGPGKLCQALEITSTFQGHDLMVSPLWLEPPQIPLKSSDIVRTTRIGITKAVEELARYYIKDNMYVSRR